MFQNQVHDSFTCKSGLSNGKQQLQVRESPIRTVMLAPLFTAAWRDHHWLLHCQNVTIAAAVVVVAVTSSLAFGVVTISATSKIRNENVSKAKEIVHMLFFVAGCCANWALQIHWKPEGRDSHSFEDELNRFSFKNKKQQQEFHMLLWSRQKYPRPSGVVSWLCDLNKKLKYVRFDYGRGEKMKQD